MPRTARLILIFLPLLLFAFAQAGTTTSGEETNEPDPDEQQLQYEIGEIHEDVEVSLVSVYLTATNKQGDFVTDLSQNDFILKEDGVVQEVTNFTNFFHEDSQLPLTVVFLADDSPSMSEGTKDSRKIDIAKQAGLLVLNELSKDDQMFLLTFHQKEFDSAPKREEIRQRLIALKTRYGISPLFDTIDSTIDQLNRLDSRKLLIICSDGQDLYSQRSLNEVLTKLKRADDILVVSLGTVDYERSPDLYWFGQEADYRNGKDAMERLAESGGGYAFFPSRFKDLDSVMEKIRKLVKSQYSLGYRSTNQKPDATWRNIEIVCKRPDVKLRFRRGYYAAASS